MARTKQTARKWVPGVLDHLAAMHKKEKEEKESKERLELAPVKAAHQSLMDSFGSTMRAPKKSTGPVVLLTTDIVHSSNVARATAGNFITLAKSTTLQKTNLIPVSDVPVANTPSIAPAQLCLSSSTTVRELWPSHPPPKHIGNCLPGTTFSMADADRVFEDIRVRKIRREKRNQKTQARMRIASGTRKKTTRRRSQQLQEEAKLDQLRAAARRLRDLPGPDMPWKQRDKMSWCT